MTTSSPLPVLDGRAQAISALHERILGCRSCERDGFVSAARPVRHPWTPRQRTMLVGQAPGAQTDRLRVHFAGPGGKLLGQWLAAAGFDDPDWRDRCYITSMTRCFPGKAPSGKGDRRPGPAELARCQPFLEDELRLVRPRLILAVGTLAIEYFLGRRPLEAVVGTIGQADGRPILPLPHPSPVSRWLNDPEHRRLVDRAIELLSRARVELGL
jgi:uracil-DNA glycosylase